MRRWNGWGDDTIQSTLNGAALQFLQERVGETTSPDDASLEATVASVPTSRLPTHPRWSTDAEVRVRASFGQSLPDWLRLRFGKLGRVVDAVAYAESGDDVREVLDLALQHRAIVIPYAGGTSVVGHLTPPQTDQPVISLNLSRLNRLLHLDHTAQLATFQAGVAGPDLEAQLRAQGYTLGHFPQSFEYSTLGGWIVTRSSGQQSLRYGRIEQLFAGGRVETPAGRLMIPTFPASSAGPDLRELVMGSEGRFGVLTEATVRVTPLPEFEQFHAVFFPSWAQAETAVRTLVQSRLPLSMLRLSNEVETLTSLTLAGHPRLIGMLEKYLGVRGIKGAKCLLLFGVTGHAATCRGALHAARDIVKQFGGVAVGKAFGEKWKANRFRSVYLRNTLWEHGYCADTVETACDWPKVETMMRRVEAAAVEALAKFGERVHAYTHLSHTYPQGSSVYTTFVFRRAASFEENYARWQAMKQAVCETMGQLGGTISHQHGVGKDHAPYLAAEKGPLGMDALMAIVRQLDPDGIMNSGNLGL
ncbi:FAD-binding oxidoreductase [Chitinivorax sp. B]|uniref:FAD-binding oxidoreductase n=1 Tax=Chitinivorax sp. B TaxID=2502235 RepID=UPI0010F8A273|nr:FAD-binding oxidoreductase [Chitinivorax sp. B]